jgi:hypothetical protein
MCADILIKMCRGHGVLNIQESVSVATEFADAIWRIRPAPAILAKIPNDNREHVPLLEHVPPNMLR